MIIVRMMEAGAAIAADRRGSPGERREGRRIGNGARIKGFAEPARGLGKALGAIGGLCGENLSHGRNRARKVVGNVRKVVGEIQHVER